MGGGQDQLDMAGPFHGAKENVEKLSEIAERDSPAEETSPELSKALVKSDSELWDTFSHDDLTILEERMEGVEENATFVEWGMEAGYRPDSFEAELMRKRLDQCMAAYEDMVHLGVYQKWMDNCMKKMSGRLIRLRAEFDILCRELCQDEKNPSGKSESTEPAKAAEVLTELPAVEAEQQKQAMSYRPSKCRVEEGSVETLSLRDSEEKRKDSPREGRPGPKHRG